VEVSRVAGRQARAVSGRCGGDEQVHDPRGASDPIAGTAAAKRP
jgi:hypothetical protein